MIDVFKILFDKSRRIVKSLIDVKAQVAVFKKHKDEIFNTNGKAKPYSDVIYKTLASKLKGMSEKAIQSSINRNVKLILQVCSK